MQKEFQIDIKDSHIDSFEYVSDDLLNKGSECVDIEGDEKGQSIKPGNKTQRDNLIIEFKKVPCQANGEIVLRLADDEWEVNTSVIENSIKDKIKLVTEEIFKDPLRVRAMKSIDDNIRIPDDALKTEQDFQDFLNNFNLEVIPEWAWDIRAKVTNYSKSNELLIFIGFTNSSKVSKKSLNQEGFFFDCTAMFAFKGCQVIPFELALAPKSFRYDQELWGRGFNCAISNVNNDSKLSPMFCTTNTPIFDQKRYKATLFQEASFDNLSKDPIPILEKILSSMKNYLIKWDSSHKYYKSKFQDWEEKYAKEFEGDKEAFVEETNRFEQGIELLKCDKDILLAFKLTNKTFNQAGDGKKTHWRLFQLIFLVSQVPDIYLLKDGIEDKTNRRNIVDIIYFPTGGGKTEAYLAVIVFHCFFDRLRGKYAGVTSWIRFPLRLLTLQQTQRIADMMGIAELVRQDEKDPRLNGPEISGFSVGYFVGKESTPNEIEIPIQSENIVWSQATDEKVRQRWKTITRCPSCKTKSVYIDFDQNNIRILHRCKNESCKFPNNIIPIYIVDNEIYRNLPSVIVGTIDKLASLGNQKNMALLFGRVDGICETHGYFVGNKCIQKGCNQKKLKKKVPKGISGPTLFVQDELHLLKEGLGTFDSHYETFAQCLLRIFGQTHPLKIIASSATAEAFDRQIKHLYGRSAKDARIFPHLGPSLDCSFYADTLEYPQRLYVGILPHNKVIFNAILELVQYYHEVLYDLRDNIYIGQLNPYGGQFIPGTKEWKDLIDLYSTSLVYFLAHRNLDSIGKDFIDTVGKDLESKGISLNFEELTGSTSSEHVTNILEKLETPLLPPGEAIDSVLATSMISHGVDIDRLNAMIFYGMPRQNAEYIQSSSRVGRSHIGIIFNCLHPARERDQSHYSYFIKFHEFLGRLIEPVAINRWSKFSIERTLPGLFMAILLQIIANNPNNKSPGMYYTFDFVKKEVIEGRITANDFIPILEKAYLVDGAEESEKAEFKKDISELINIYLDHIKGAISQDGFVSSSLPKPPMTSLREMDDPIEIELNSRGTDWGRRKVK